MVSRFGGEVKAPSTGAVRLGTILVQLTPR